MNFRMHSVRMQLQLDTRPLQDTVEEYARIVLSELELLTVAVPENASKHQKVAALGAETRNISPRSMLAQQSCAWPHLAEFLSSEHRL